MHIPWCISKPSIFSPNIDYILVYAKNLEFTIEFRDDISQDLIDKVYNQVEKTGEKTGEKYKQEAANESNIGEGNIIKGSDGKNHSVE